MCDSNNCNEKKLFKAMVLEISKSERQINALGENEKVNNSKRKRMREG